MLLCFHKMEKKLFQIFVSFSIILLSCSASPVYASTSASADAELSDMISKVFQLAETDPDSALTLNSKAWERARKADDDSSLYMINSAFAQIYSAAGNHELAVEYYLKNLRLLESDHEDILTSQIKTGRLYSVYNNLGISFYMLDMVDKAIEYFYRALEVFTQAEKYHPGLLNQINKASILFNIGGGYLRMEDWENAGAIYEEIAEMNRELQDSRIHINYLNNRGIYYLNTGETDLAFDYFYQGLDLGREMNNYLIIARINNNIGNHYYLEGSFDIAMAYYTGALDAAAKAGEWRSQKIASHKLSHIYEQLGDFQMAYEHLKHSNFISDSILRPEMTESAARISAQYTFDRDIRISRLEQDALWKGERWRRILFMLVSVVLSLLLVIAMITVLSTRRKSRLVSLTSDYHRLEAEKAKKEKEAFALKLETQNRHLAEKALWMAEKSQLIQSTVDNLEAVSKNFADQSKPHLKEIIQQLQTDSKENFWNEFSLRFSEVHNGFFASLQEKFPELTPSEKKLAALLRLNLSTKEIAAIVHQSPDSLKVARSRLRKKLGLEPSQNLVGFLESI